MPERRPRTEKFPPADFDTWEAIARKKRVLTKKLHTRTKVESGSKVTELEFVLLHTLWPDTIRRKAAAELGLDETVTDQNLQARGNTWIEIARNWLANLPAFARYLSAVQQKPHPASADLGKFTPTYNHQYQIQNLLAGDSPQNASMDGINENIVNIGLVDLLIAICLGHPFFNGVWSPRRAELTFGFTNGPELVCQLDGFLYSERTGRTQMILEAKAKNRDDHLPNVPRQESYELVTALLNGPPRGLPRNRAILISQDGTELYIAHAVHTEQYKLYMEGQASRIREPDFVRIYQYGPWRISRRADMEDFATLVLAIAIRATAEDPHPVPHS